jgi:hypothetical protein
LATDTAEQRSGEEPLDPGQPFHLGMPGAQDVVGIVVVGIDRDGFCRFIEDDLGIAHTFLAALGEREPAQHHR